MSVDDGENRPAGEREIGSVRRRERRRLRTTPLGFSEGSPCPRLCGGMLVEADDALVCTDCDFRYPGESGPPPGASRQPEESGPPSGASRQPSPNSGGGDPELGVVGSDRLSPVELDFAANIPEAEDRAASRSMNAATTPEPNPSELSPANSRTTGDDRSDPTTLDAGSPPPELGEGWPSGRGEGRGEGRSLGGERGIPRSKVSSIELPPRFQGALP